MNNIMKYKGYIGVLSILMMINVFFGRLEMSDDLVTFEADNTDELECSFQDSVNDYIEFRN